MGKWERKDNSKHSNSKEINRNRKLFGEYSQATTWERNCEFNYRKMLVIWMEFD